MSTDARPERGARWRLHAVGAVALPGCLAAGVFELTRALGGNSLSWAYAVEWPVIGGYVCYMWVRLAREQAAGPVVRPARPAGSRAAATPVAPEPDPQLVAWQQYLARLHADDPPGGPQPG